MNQSNCKKEEVSRGKWIPVARHPDIRCSLCGMTWSGGHGNMTYCPSCGAKMNEANGPPTKKNVYLLFTPYDELARIYLSTDMSKEEIGDLYAGFWFYVEANSFYGEECMLDIDMTAYLLCSLCGCTVYDSKKLYLLNKYDSEQKDLRESERIDLWDERDRRWADREPYIQKVMKYADAEFVRKLCAYFDSDAFHEQPLGSGLLSPEQIMEWY